MLQICHPASFVSISLSIPFPKDRSQVFLHRHLLSVAAVAVRENPVRVSLGQRLCAVFHRFPPTARERETRGRFHYTTTLITFTFTRRPCMWRLWGRAYRHSNQSISEVQLIRFSSCFVAGQCSLCNVCAIVLEFRDANQISNLVSGQHRQSEVYAS